MCSHLSLTPVSEAYKGYMFQLRKRSTLGQYRKDYKVEAQKERKEKKRDKKNTSSLTTHARKQAL